MDGFRTIKSDVDMGVDNTGNLYVLNSSTNKVRKLDSNGRVLNELIAPPGANYIRVDRNGSVQAIKYMGSRIEIFNSTTKQASTANGFITPSGLSIVLDKRKGISGPQNILILDTEGNIVKQFGVASDNQLYWVDYIGSDYNNNIYLALEKQSNKTKQKEIAPNEYKTIKLIGDYVQKYGVDDAVLRAEMPYIFGESDLQAWVTGYSKCFTVDKNGNVYLLVMFGNPYGNVGSFKVYKWERSAQ